MVTSLGYPTVCAASTAVSGIVLFNLQPHSPGLVKYPGVPVFVGNVSRLLGELVESTAPGGFA